MNHPASEENHADSARRNQANLADQPKPWKPLVLKVLDVPTETKGAHANRLDPTEDFFLYRIS